MLDACTARIREILVVDASHPPEPRPECMSLAEFCEWADCTEEKVTLLWASTALPVRWDAETGAVFFLNGELDRWMAHQAWLLLMDKTARD